jgi:sulfoxide reductase heme-binding subunit YedZ
MTSDPSAHLFWITSRAAGTSALTLSSAAVSMGLAMGIRRGRSAASRRATRADAPAKLGPLEFRGIHEALSLATMVSIAVHGLTLIGDGYLHPSLLDVTVPFVTSYQTLATSLGIIAGWGLLVLGLSYYLRRRIGARRWRVIHRLTVLAWLAGLGHAFTEGTDAGQLWFVMLALLPALFAAALVARRLSLLPARAGAYRGSQDPRAEAHAT